MKKPRPQLNVRLSPDLREPLERACEKTGLDAATVARACIQAFIEEVEATGEIRLPLSIIPKSKKPQPPQTPGSATASASDAAGDATRRSARPSSSTPARGSRIKPSPQSGSPSRAYSHTSSHSAER